MSNPLSTPVKEQVKAVIGAAVAGLTALGTALTDGLVTGVEGVGIAVAVLTTYSVVFGASNAEAEGDEDFRDYEDVDTFHDGHGA